MTKGYRRWKKEARRQAVEQWDLPPCSPVSIAVLLQGPQRGDLDNLAGAVMDVLTGVAYPDDSVSHVRRLLVRWSKAPIKDQQITVIIHAQMPKVRIDAHDC